MIDQPENLLQPHERWMQYALDQARQAYEAEEVPIGAVVVQHERVIGEGHNQREMLKRSDSACGDDRHHAGGGRIGILAAAGLHAVRDAGALPDVCRCDRTGPDSACRLRDKRIPKRVRAIPCIRSPMILD